MNKNLDKIDYGTVQIVTMEGNCPDCDKKFKSQIITMAIEDKEKQDYWKRVYFDDEGFITECPRCKSRNVLLHDYVYVNLDKDIVIDYRAEEEDKRGPLEFSPKDVYYVIVNDYNLMKSEMMLSSLGLVDTVFSYYIYYRLAKHNKEYNGTLDKIDVGCNKDENIQLKFSDEQGHIWVENFDLEVYNKIKESHPELMEFAHNNISAIDRCEYGRKLAQTK